MENGYSIFRHEETCWFFSLFLHFQVSVRAFLVTRQISSVMVCGPCWVRSQFHINSVIFSTDCHQFWQSISQWWLSSDGCQVRQSKYSTDHCHMRKLQLPQQVSWIRTLVTVCQYYYPTNWMRGWISEHMDISMYYCITSLGYALKHSMQILWVK